MMERKIKLKCWDRRNKKWVNNFLVSENGFVYPVGKRIEPLNRISCVDIVEYTGLSDKNGKEIYEGDILRNEWTNVNGKDIGNNWLVLFGEYIDADVDYGSSGHIGFYAHAIRPEADDLFLDRPLHNLPTNEGNDNFEVIGNIHEHPHLFEERK